MVIGLVDPQAGECLELPVTVFTRKPGALGRKEGTDLYSGGMKERMKYKGYSIVMKTQNESKIK